MTRGWRTVLSCLGVIVAAVAALGAIYLTAPAPPATPAADLSLTQLSGKGLYRVALVPDAGVPSVGVMHGWTMTVSLPDGTPVTGATAAIDGGMPAHNHGLPTAPRMTAELGAGRYRIEGVKFSMSGLWVVKIALSATAGSDEAKFNLQI